MLKRNTSCFEGESDSEMIHDTPQMRRNSLISLDSYLENRSQTNRSATELEGYLQNRYTSANSIDISNNRLDNEEQGSNVEPATKSESRKKLLSSLIFTIVLLLVAVGVLTCMVVKRSDKGIDRKYCQDDELNKKLQIDLQTCREEKETLKEDLNNERVRWANKESELRNELARNQVSMQNQLEMVKEELKNEIEKVKELEIEIKSLQENRDELLKQTTGFKEALDVAVNSDMRQLEWIESAVKSRKLEGLKYLLKFKTDGKMVESLQPSSVTSIEEIKSYNGKAYFTLRSVIFNIMDIGDLKILHLVLTHYEKYIAAVSNLEIGKIQDNYSPCKFSVLECAKRKAWKEKKPEISKYLKQYENEVFLPIFFTQQMEGWCGSDYNEKFGKLLTAAIRERTYEELKVLAEMKWTEMEEFYVKELIKENDREYYRRRATNDGLNGVIQLFVDYW